jgi:hypothetical protein
VVAYTVEVDLDDFDDYEILDAAKDIIDCTYIKKDGSKTETLIREIYDILIKKYENLEELEMDNLFIRPSTAATIKHEKQLKNYVEESKDFKFFSK